MTSDACSIHKALNQSYPQKCVMRRQQCGYHNCGCIECQKRCTVRFCTYDLLQGSRFCDFHTKEIEDFEKERQICQFYGCNKFCIYGQNFCCITHATQPDVNTSGGPYFCEQCKKVKNKRFVSKYCDVRCARIAGIYI
jgi:hypothetical protein